MYVFIFFKEKMAFVMRISVWSSYVCSSDLEAKPLRDVLVYASYSKGYKSGTFNGRATSGPALNEVLPENSDSYEIGVQSQFWDRRVTLNLSVYDVTYKNLQTTVTVRDSTGAPATALLTEAEPKAKGYI